ncbi:MAG: cytochrome c [Mariprofundaceae bacterium]
MRRLELILLAAAMIVAASACAAKEKAAASAERGKDIYDNLCIHCHRTDSQLSKVGASGLAGVANRRDAAWLVQWLKNPAGFSKQDEVAKAVTNSYPYNMPMPALPLMQQDESRADVIEYLKTLSNGEAEAAE